MRAAHVGTRKAGHHVAEVVDPPRVEDHSSTDKKTVMSKIIRATLKVPYCLCPTYHRVSVLN